MVVLSILPLTLTCKSVRVRVLLTVLAVSINYAQAEEDGMQQQKQCSQTGVCFYNRTGELIQERIESGGLLAFLYNNSIGRMLRPMIMNKYMARWYSYYQDSSWSIKDIQPFIDRHSIDMHDFIVPTGGYTSFNHFFIRSFKPHVRAINDEHSSITSPIDGKLFVIENIDKNVTFFVKNERFDTQSFVKSEDLAKRVAGGTMIIARLAPYDYHRFHLPVSGLVSEPRVIAGALESVNPMAYKAGVQPLITNERHCIAINTQRSGTVLVLPVGAAFVSRIKYTFPFGTQGVKGDELGYFEFGGSTVVLLFERDTITLRQDLIQHSQQGYETAVLMGERIATIRGV